MKLNILLTIREKKDLIFLTAQISGSKVFILDFPICVLI